MIQMGLMRLNLHAWDWISVVQKYWFKWYCPKPQEGGGAGTNFLRGTNNVLQAWDHKTQSLIKNGGQQKCFDKALHIEWAELSILIDDF